MGVNIIETKNCRLENSTPTGIYSMGYKYHAYSITPDFLCQKTLPSKEKHMGANIIETKNCRLENSTPTGIYSMG